MKWHQHLVSGVSSGLLLYTGYHALTGLDVQVAQDVCGMTEQLFVPAHPVLLAACFAGYGVGLLVPDLDSETSKMGRKLREMEHRTWLHSIYAVLALLVFLFVPQAMALLILGYFVHLFWDSFSKCGIAWFKPESGYRHYGNTGAKIRRGWHLVLYKNDTQAWILCFILTAVSVFVFSRFGL